KFADGFASLRIEFLPAFTDIINDCIKTKLFFVVKFEETIREEIFIRKHLNTEKKNSDDANEEVDELPIENPRCVDPRCKSTGITVWKRNVYGKLFCKMCYNSPDLSEDFFVNLGRHHVHRRMSMKSS
ncbi:hypothetical protein PRIPAC_73061, partial [Pristionchus pacificus]|uniref:Uncharacterized protein n=1 Tax=Pristionchus pacificus TaxID=54126 RepID=A0A2A6CZP7_PRIPA